MKLLVKIYALHNSANSSSITEVTVPFCVIGQTYTPTTNQRSIVYYSTTSTKNWYWVRCQIRTCFIRIHDINNLTDFSTSATTFTTATTSCGKKYKRTWNKKSLIKFCVLLSFNKLWAWFSNQRFGLLPSAFENSNTKCKLYIVAGSHLF